MFYPVKYKYIAIISSTNNIESITSLTDHVERVSLRSASVSVENVSPEIFA